MSQKDLDSAKQTLQSALSSVSDAAQSVTDQLDAGLGAVSSSARQGSAYIVNQGGEILNRLEDVQATGAAHLEATEHNVLSALRQQVKESAFRSATESSKALKLSVESLSKESAEVSQRATLALEGLTKARSVAAASKGELEDLTSRMEATCSEYEGVQETLKPLKSEDVVALRTDISGDLSTLEQDLRKIKTVVAQMTSNKV